MTEKFIMTGIGGIWNYGCEAIVRTTFDMLTEAFPQCRVGLVSYTPDYDIDALSDIPIHIIPVRPRWGVHRIIRKLLRTVHIPSPHIFNVSPSFFRKASCILSIGGDIYTPHICGLPWGFLKEEEELLKMGKPVVLWGATVGPFQKGTEEDKRMHAYLNKVRLITARESLTMQYLSDQGVADHSKLVCDPAFVLRPEKFDSEFVRPKNEADAVIGFNFSPLLGLLKMEKGKTIIEVGVECVRTLLDSLPVSVALIPHVVAGGEINNDFLLLERITKHMGNADGRVSLLPPNLGACKTKYYLSKCDVVVAARMHCAIGALSSLTPTICISYSQKSIGVLGDIFNNERWIVSLKELSGPILAERVKCLLDRQQVVRNHLEKVIPLFQDKARDAVRQLKKVL